MKYLSLLIIVMLPLFVRAQEKRVESSITKATVFLNKAQVTRKVKATVPAGKTDLILTGLSSGIEPQSIQVSGKGTIVILGVSHRQNYLNEQDFPRAIQVLKDSLSMLQRRISFETAQKEILNREEQMVLANQKIGGTDRNITAAELKAMADFYRSRLGDIIRGKLAQDEKIEKLSTRIGRLQQQINEQNALYTRNTSEIVVSVSAAAESSVDLDVDYLVPNAGWVPMYDMRATNTASPIQMSYKANVFQSTGEDWRNIRLRLSTSNPSLGGVKPELYAWHLDFYRPVVRQLKGKVAGVERSTAAPSAVSDVDERAEEMETIADYVTTIQTSLSTEFDIAVPYSVASGNKPTLVDVRNYEIKADYGYEAVPKLDQDAFLIAKTTGWEDLSILPGEANVFFEGTFVGKTFIDPNTIRDTLGLSLGRDRRIVVKREKLKDFSSKKLIGTNRRAEFAYEIAVRNAKAEPVTIQIEDHIPVSKNSQIEVTAIDLGTAKYNRDTGKLAWGIQLKPGETKKVTYRFEVKYPKDEVIAGLD